MRDKILLRVIVLLSISWATVASSAAKRSRPRKTVVRFLATSTSVRNSWGTSQDVYLVELVPNTTGEKPVLARLVDDYPYYHEALLAPRFNSTTGTVLMLLRDSTCDIEFTQMPLRTPPGDLEAILPERLGYRPSISEETSPDEVLPCYRLAK